MNCHECQSNIPAYLTSQVDEITEKKLLRHLVACPVCSEILTQEQKLSSLMDYLDSDIPAIDISQKVMKAITTSPEFEPIVAEGTLGAKAVQSTPFSLLQDLLAAAAAAIIIFSSLNAVTVDLKVSDYGLAINSVSNGIGNLASSYVKFSSDTVSNIIINLEEINLFSKGDELR